MLLFIDSILWERTVRIRDVQKIEIKNPQITIYKPNPLL